MSCSELNPDLTLNYVFKTITAVTRISQIHLNMHDLVTMTWQRTA